MRYRYAIDDNGAVTDVLTLDRGTNASRRTLRCMGCHDQVVAVLGALKERHFRHKRVGERKCSRETYLHSLGKSAIAESFQGALAAGRPFPLTLEVPQICRRWEQELGFTCERARGVRVFDLTRHFDTVAVEARVESFVADVLLSSSKTGEKLLIEVVVTHECTPEKIKTGARIIEIGVDQEEDTLLLRNGIDTRRGWIRLHNFKRQLPIEGPCTPKCRRNIAAFYVFESGKSFLKVGRPREIAAIKNSEKTVHMHLIEDATDGIITPYLAAESGYHLEAIKALEAGAPIKCCTFCRYAGFRTLEKPVFCKVKRLEVGVNEAAACPMYRLRAQLNDERREADV